MTSPHAHPYGRYTIPRLLAVGGLSLSLLVNGVGAQTTSAAANRTQARTASLPSGQWLNPLIKASMSNGQDASGSLTGYGAHNSPPSTATPSWWAYDLSSVPVGQRQTLRIFYNDHDVPDRYDSVNDATYTGNLGEFKIQGNVTSGGGSAPAGGRVPYSV